MPVEIERKFLVDKIKWGQVDKPIGLDCKQTYLNTDPNKTIRVRVLGEKGYLTIKGKMKGLTRAEYEYEIPLEEANEMISLFGEKVLEKTRCLINYKGKIWEVDVFAGDNEGLIVAEIELGHEEEPFTKPEWVTEEVSTDPRYLNVNLQEKPFSDW